MSSPRNLAPDLTASLDELLFELVRQQHPLAAALQPGLTLEELHEAFAPLPFEPPDELLAWFGWRNGVGAGLSPEGLFEGFRPLSLEEALADHRQWVEELNDPDFEFRPPVLFPLLEAHGCHYALWCGRDTRRGAILYAGREDTPRPKLDRLADLVQAVAECYRRGAYRCDPRSDEVEVDEALAQVIWARHQQGRAQVFEAAVSAAAVDWDDHEAILDLAPPGPSTAKLALGVVERGLATGHVPHPALVVLAEAPPPEALPVLLRVLELPDELLQSAAVTALERLGHPDAGLPLLALFERGSSSVAEDALFMPPGTTVPDVLRAAVVQAFQSIRDPRVIAPAARLLDSPSSEVRAGAAGILGAQRDAAALPQLLRALVDPEEYVALAAVQALGELGDGRAVGPLVEALERGLATRHRIERSLAMGSSRRTLAEAAAEALASLDGRAAAGALQGLLRELLSELEGAAYPRHASTVLIAGRIAHAVGRWGAIPPAELVVTWLERCARGPKAPAPHLSWPISTAAEELLRLAAHHEGERVASTARRWVQSLEPWQRPSAVEALAGGAATWVGAFVAELACDPAPRLREAAVRALGGRTTPEAVSTLVLAAEDEHPLVRWRAVLSLGSMAGEVAVRALRAALRDPNEVVAAEALASLWRIDAEAARSNDRIVGEPDLLRRTREALEAESWR